MRKLLNKILEYGLLIIITIPSFTSLLNPYFFSMHDSQQVSRLYVLTEGLKQGSLYPRWVDLFGFNYGYPLFNFYPPLIYYWGALFHALGFSFLWSVKLVFISGYVIGASGMYLLVKKLLAQSLDSTKQDRISKASAYLAAVLYTFFTYHAVNAYVRGAMAEFFSMAVLPFVFLALECLRQRLSMRNALFFGVMFAVLILTHPLIAFPAVIFIGAYILHGMVLHKHKLMFTAYHVLGGVLGLMLSAFFWLPSMIERKYTLVDSILLKELASYQIHFVQPIQLWFSPWGYGGSGPGLQDGMSFQLGKVHMAIAVFSLFVCLCALFFFRKKARAGNSHVFSDFGFFFTFMLGAMFMMTEYSVPLWKAISFLQYLQFPWRFMTFVGLFISIVGAYGVYFVSQELPARLSAKLSIVFVIALSLMTIFAYQKYFRPQNYLKQTDAQLTSFDEIAWRVSRTSFEFVPKGIITRKSDLGTTILAIDKSDINRSQFNISDGTADVTSLKNDYENKVFNISTTTGVLFTLHTYSFPGWTAYIDGQKTAITDSNAFKLITVSVPSGKHQLRFSFDDTPVRMVANWISVLSLAGIVAYVFISFVHRTAGK